MNIEFVSPHLVVFLGVIITLFSSFVTCFLTENKCYKVTAYVFLFFGTLVSFTGGVLSSMQQEKYQKHVVNSITGGDSYCYVLMTVDKYSDWAHLALMYVGDYPVHEIEIQFVDVNKLSNILNEIAKLHTGDKEEYEHFRKNNDLNNLYNVKQKEATKVFKLPILSPSVGYELGSFKLPSDITEHHYRVKIFCRNGTFHQEIKCRKIEDNWRFSVRVNKFEGQDYPVLEESIHPAIPL